MIGRRRILKSERQTVEEGSADGRWLAGGRPRVVMFVSGASLGDDAPDLPLL